MTEGLKLLLSLSLSGAALVGLTACVRLLLRRRVPRAFCYYLWLLALLRLVCPVGTDESLSHQALSQEPALWTVTGAKQGTGETGLCEGISLAPEDVPMDTGNALSAVLPVIWAAGMILVLGGRLWSHRRLRKELNRTATEIHPWEQALYRTAAGRKAGIPELLRSDGADAPVLVGLLRPRIYLPAAEMPAEALGYALRHELVHWRRKDLWYKYALTVVTALHWFNPAVWLMARLMERDCELSCDEAVVRGLSREGRMEYGRTLLWAAANQSGLPNGLSASFWSQKAYLKERLYGIMRPNRLSKMTVALLAAAVLSLSAASVVLGAYNGPEEPEGKLPDVSGQAKPITEVLDEPEVQLAWPFADTEEIVLSALYGKRIHPITKMALTEHTGIDVVLEQGTPILASAAGTVQEVRFTGENGNYVEIDHGNGMTTRYGHMETADFVREGDLVSVGEQIGTVGKTGTSTGYHLHFEVTEDSSRVDPLDYLPHDGLFVGHDGRLTQLKR